VFVLPVIFIYLFRHEISELPRPTGYGFLGHSPRGVAASEISTTQIVFPVELAAPGGLALGSAL